jgi:peptidyl-prolyl cis-trans isomerase SurA
LRATFATIAVVFMFVASGAAASNNLVAPGAAAPQQTALAAPQAPDASNADSIGAIVNSDTITDYDLRQRVALYLATAGVEPTPELMKKIRTQILDQLVTERLQIQEAKRKNITISSPEIDKALNRIVDDNHITLDQLKQVLTKNGASVGALRSQLAAQILWQKVVEDEFQDRINISDSEVDAEMARLEEGRNKAHFLVTEIFLAVDTPDQDAKVLRNIQDLETQLQTGAPINVLARQFSQSPSAAAGGDIGWVYDGQLAAELNAELVKMSTGSISQPIRATGGYYILALRERQEASNTKLPDPASQVQQGPVDKLPLARLLLPMPPKPPPAALENAMKYATQVAERVTGCAQLQKIASQIHGEYQDMGLFRVKDLSEQLQKALEKSEPGRAVPPFQDQAGIEVVLRCDKAIPKLQAYHMPSRKEVEEQLFDQQVTAFARRYMRDLRRQADVEIR